MRICFAATRVDLDHHAIELDRLRSELIAVAPLSLLAQDEQTFGAVAEAARSARSQLSDIADRLHRPEQLGGAALALHDGQSASLEAMGETFFAHAARLAEANASSLAGLDANLKSLSVSDTMSRGFVLATSLDDGRLVSTARDARVLKNLCLHFVDGLVAVCPETFPPNATQKVKGNSK